MDEFALLVDFHKSQDRQGPGSDQDTRKAIELAGLGLNELKIADIGCGTGASTLVLASELNAQITAVDLFPEFLDELNIRSERLGVSEKISSLVCSMDDLPFTNSELDVIWSEGAIYNIGFENGVRQWRRFLKPGGILAVSELTWITGNRPEEIQMRWEKEYAEVDTASAKINVLEQNGYSPIGYFILPENCWLDNYYLPLKNGFNDFLSRNGNSEQAKAVVEEHDLEQSLYLKYKEYFSYGFFVAKKVDD